VTGGNGNATTGGGTGDGGSGVTGGCSGGVTEMVALGSGDGCFGATMMVALDLGDFLFLLPDMGYIPIQWWGRGDHTGTLPPLYHAYSLAYMHYYSCTPSVMVVLDMYSWLLLMLVHENYTSR